MYYFDRIKIINPFARERDGVRYIDLSMEFNPHFPETLHCPTQNAQGFNMPPQDEDEPSDYGVTYIIEELGTGLFELGHGLLTKNNTELERLFVLDSSNTTIDRGHELNFYKVGYDLKPLNETDDPLVNEDNSFLMNATLSLTVSGADLNRSHTGGLINSMIFGD